MNLESEILDVNSFKLESSREIQGVIRDLEKVNKDNVLVHIISFIHNTVLVQSLKNELAKVLPNAKIVLLKHEDKTKTQLTIYSLKKEIDPQNLSDEIAKELYTRAVEESASVKEYRNKLFSRYFTDHLTNLPNTYKLRNDLDEFKEFSLVVFNIDNFQMINNFYGYIVGDYVIEKVGKFLKENIPQHHIYKLSGDEFAFIIDREIGFYELKDYLDELYEKMKNIIVEYQDINIYVDFTLASSANRDSKNIFSKVSMALKYAKEIGAKYWIYEDRMNFENE
ncbi:MAG: GGDEF domain-containing protein, partial [Sulfurimonas sp.]